MAKGIYIGAEQAYKKVAGDIIPKEWTSVSSNEYAALDGTSIVASEFTCNTGTRSLNKVADGDTSTWCAASSTTKNASLTLTFPGKRKITKMKTYITANNTSYFKKMVIRGSSDNSSWVDLYETTTAQTGLTEFSLNNADYYQYYKLSLTLSGYDYLRLYEWQVSEYVTESEEIVEAASKVKKGYVGADSVSFTSNPAPTTGWTTDSYKKSTTSNSYGTWNIESTSSYGSSNYSVDKAFDGKADTAYITKALTSDEQEEYL